jgi:hypothetical protein
VEAAGRELMVWEMSMVKGGSEWGESGDGHMGRGFRQRRGAYGVKIRHDEGGGWREGVSVVWLH